MEGKESAEIPQKPKVLYIEDDKTLGRLLPRFVPGFQFQAVDTMPKAEEMLKEDWDAVVTDYDFPGGSGFEIAQFLKEQNRGIPVVVISGRKFEPEELEENGVFYALQKPFKIEEALETFGRVQEIIDSKKAQ